MLKFKTKIKWPLLILIALIIAGSALYLRTRHDPAAPQGTSEVSITSENEASTTGESKAAATGESEPQEAEGVPGSIFMGKVICIDPGHGDPNHPVQNEKIAPASEILKPATASGTVGATTKIPEYQLTLAVSLKIRGKLQQLGAEVIMTRESNEVDLDNIERAEIANKNAADISLRIHADGSEDPSFTGISVIYPGDKYLADEELIAKSKLAADFVLNGLIEKTKGRSRGIVARNDLTGFNWSKVPVILVEMGFMTNPAEDQALNTEDYQNKIVDGIIKGLDDYFRNINH
jgi:N-acetylmuramoyl-L-alanine amidase